MEIVFKFMQHKYHADRIVNHFTIVVNLGGEPLSNGVVSLYRPFEALANINLKELKLPTVSNEKLDGIIRRQEESYKTVRGSVTRDGVAMTKELKSPNSTTRPVTQLIITKLGTEVSPNTAEYVLGSQTWKAKISSWENIPFEKQIAACVLDIIHDRFRVLNNVSFSYKDETGKSFTYKF